MKLRTRVLSLLTVAVMLVTALTVNVAAANARFDPTRLTLDPDDTGYLTYIVNGVDGNITASSSNNDVAYAEVISDDTVAVYAYEPGSCTVTLKISGSSITATASVTVTGTASSSSTWSSDEDTASLITYRTDDSAESSRTTASSSTTSKTTTKAPGTITLTEKASREEVIEAASSGTALRNIASVSAESLQAASGVVRFDTRNDTAVVGRLAITTANANRLTGDIRTGVYTGTGNTSKVQTRFDKNFSNNTRVVLCDQGNYDMTVRVTVPVGTLSADNLYFYSYNADANRYSALDVTGVSKDKNNYLSFNTNIGGYIVISDGALAR